MMWLVWLPLIALFVWFVIRVTRNNDTGQTNRRSAVDILKEKFAEGKISREEYEDRIDILRRG